MKVGVIANSGKSLDGGLLELRRALERAGIADPLWHEVPKSRKAPKAMRRLLDAETELVFVWGGDGMLQRCIDVAAGSDVALAIVPAGTSNLLATNLGVPSTSSRRWRSASTESGAAWTSVASTASASRSWPGAAWTRR